MQPGDRSAATRSLSQRPAKLQNPKFDAVLLNVYHNAVERICAKSAPNRRLRVELSDVQNRKHSARV